jgi:integrase/recombinase XerD
MKRRNVQERLTIYGSKVKLEGVRVSPHTFRHTFAKMYIMRDGDPFSLQALLGHSTLDMVRHYVNLWGSDLQKMHRQFSPVDHLLRS